MPKQTIDTGAGSLSAHGLFLRGVLRGRRRKEFKREGQPLRYIIQLAVLAGNVVHQVDVWSDEKLPDSIPTVGTEVSLPVEVRTFTTARGTQSRLVIAGEGAGENF